MTLQNFRKSDSLKTSLDVSTPILNTDNDCVHVLSAFASNFQLIMVTARLMIDLVGFNVPLNTL